VDRHHIRKIFGRGAEAPAIPIEKPHVASTVTRQEAVPHMRVAVNDRHAVSAVGARHQTPRAIEQ